MLAEPQARMPALQSKIVNERNRKAPWYERWLGISFAQPAAGVPTADLPEGGRSSIETAPGGGLGLMPGIGYASPPFDLQILTELKRLSICNPDFSQFVGNSVALANSGHSITVETKDSNKAEAVLARLNEAARTLYRNGCGIDGLMNAYIKQVATFGAISSEDVVDLNGRRVQEVVLVPVEQIRFRFENDQYVPKQTAFTLFNQKGVQRSKGALGLIDLNPLTYRYLALQTLQNSPYAIPLATAAVDILMGPQKDVLDSLGPIVRRLAALGIILGKLTRPKKDPGESDREYRGRAQEYMTKVRDSLGSIFTKAGLLLFFDDQKLEVANSGADPRATNSVVELVEEQAFSGMGSMPFMHGRNYTTTETFADVLYHLSVSKAEDIQRLCKRRQERTYLLDLALAGIEADVSVGFNPIKSRNDLQSAQAEQARQELVMEKVRSGVIEPDAGAQELGYDSWFDSTLIAPGSSSVAGAGFSRSAWANRNGGAPGFSATFRFDRQSQRYRFVTSRIEVASAVDEAGVGSRESGAGADGAEGRLYEFKKKAA